MAFRQSYRLAQGLVQRLEYFFLKVWNCRYALVILGAGTAGAFWAQDVQFGHYAAGRNASLPVGAMPKDPGVYVLSTTFFFNVSEFRDGSGNVPPEANETDYVLTALALTWPPDFNLF